MNIVPKELKDFEEHIILPGRLLEGKRKKDIPAKRVVMLWGKIIEMRIH